MVQHLLLFLPFLFLLLRFCLRFGLSQLATGLGDGDCLLAVGVVEGSLQTSSSGRILPRPGTGICTPLQIAFSSCRGSYISGSSWFAYTRLQSGCPPGCPGHSPHWWARPHSTAIPHSQTSSLFFLPSLSSLLQQCPQLPR